jgi:hypothetical protein
MTAPLGRRLVGGLLAAGALAMAAGAASVARADMGPKPSMTFAFTFAKAGQSIRSGVLLTCEDAECAKPEPLPREGPQGFDCEPRSCFARAYGFRPYAMLDLTMSDGRTLKSNVFKTQTLLGKFKVAVAAAGLDVQPTWW